MGFSSLGEGKEGGGTRLRGAWLAAEGEASEGGEEFDTAGFDNEEGAGDAQGNPFTALADAHQAGRAGGDHRFVVGHHAEAADLGGHFDEGDVLALDEDARGGLDSEVEGCFHSVQGEGEG